MNGKDEMSLSEFADKTNLSARAYCTIARAGCKNLTDVISIAEKGELLNVRLCGVKTADEICEAVLSETGKDFKGRQRRETYVFGREKMACEKCANAIGSEGPYLSGYLICNKRIIKVERDFYCKDYRRRENDA